MKKRIKTTEQEIMIGSLQTGLKIHQESKNHLPENRLLFGENFHSLPKGLIDLSEQAVNLICNEEASTIFKLAVNYILLLKISSIYRQNPLSPELDDEAVQAAAIKLAIGLKNAKNLQDLITWTNSFFQNDQSVDRRKLIQIFAGLPKAALAEKEIPEEKLTDGHGIEIKWKDKIKCFRGWNLFLKPKRIELINKELGAAIMEIVVIFCLSEKGRNLKDELRDELIEALLVLDEHQMCNQETVLNVMMTAAQKVVGDRYRQVLKEVRTSSETLH